MRNEQEEEIALVKISTNLADFRKEEQVLAQVDMTDIKQFEMDILTDIQTLKNQFEAWKYNYLLTSCDRIVFLYESILMNDLKIPIGQLNLLFYM